MPIKRAVKASKPLKPRPFDVDGRPIVHDQRSISYSHLSLRAADVLYALALTELRGNKLGLTRRSILKILQHEADVFAGMWDWLFDPMDADCQRPKGTLGATSGHARAPTDAIVRNAVQELTQKYPVIVLTGGSYVEVSGHHDRSKGGIEPEVHALNEGAIERWPCGAYLLKAIATGIHQADTIRFETLTRYIAPEHLSHLVPEQLLVKGAKPPTPHSLREDIEFLVWSRYLRLYTHEKRDRRRQEIPYRNPLEFPDSAVIELDKRAHWEQSYFHKLAHHFDESCGRLDHS